LLVERQKKKKTSASGSAAPKQKSSAQREEFELVLSDPLLEDGVMSWPLGGVTTVGFTPGTVFLALCISSKSSVDLINCQILDSFYSKS
jgi:hypothetical protein